MKLYYKAGACSLSPHIALREAGLSFELVAVDLQTKKLPDGSDYFNINRKGSIPALEVESGEVLTEGAVIVQYIAEKANNSTLLPPVGTLARYRVQEWLNFIATELHKGFSPLFNSQTPDSYREIAKAALAKKLDYVNARLENTEYLTGATFTVADGYLFNVLFWTGSVGIDLTTRPNLAAFFKRVAQRESVKAAFAAEQLKPIV